ncbi:hypothetical protein, partial [Pseudomonas sp. SWRI99]|uniref:hypothetical protein n=1 Tax=Pseudomonas sp. SWRI99 TaxID=2745506 RepID=UPI001EE29D38
GSLLQFEMHSPVGVSLLAKAPVRTTQNSNIFHQPQHHPSPDPAILGFSILSSATTLHRLQPD